MRHFRLVAFAVAAAAAALALPAGPSLAARGLQLVTPYPAISTAAGKTVTLNVQVITPDRRRVDLAIAQAPPGWQTTLRGGGFVINAAFGGPDSPPDSRAPEIQLEIRVPPDAGEGANTIVVKGSAGGVTDLLQVNVTVSQTAAGAVTLEPDFPSVRGKSDTSFTLKAKLQNNTPNKASFALDAAGPPGWRIDARPQTETTAATVSVDGGGETAVEVSADPPDNVPAGEYPVTLRATGAGTQAETTFTVEITGNVRMTLTTVTERLNARGTAGRIARIPLVVRNEGTAPLRGVTLSQSAPSGWDVEFEPDSVQQVAPGRSARVTAKVRPAGDAIAGDYSLTLTATAEGTTSNADVRFSVRTSRFWGIVGLLLIAAIGYGLYRVFRRYGRR